MLKAWWRRCYLRAPPKTWALSSHNYYHSMAQWRLWLDSMWKDVRRKSSLSSLQRKQGQHEQLYETSGRRRFSYKAPKWTLWQGQDPPLISCWGRILSIMRKLDSMIGIGSHIWIPHIPTGIISIQDHPWSVYFHHREADADPSGHRLQLILW